MYKYANRNEPIISSHFQYTPFVRVFSAQSFAKNATALFIYLILFIFVCVVCVCVWCVCGHVYVVYEDTNLYNDMGMT